MTPTDPDAAAGQRLRRITALLAEQQAEPVEVWLRRILDDAHVQENRQRSHRRVRTWSSTATEPLTS
jgi:hypothetical protein